MTLKDLIHFAFKEVPSFLKTTSKNTKILPKELAKINFENKINFNRKQGFSIPLNKFFLKKEWFGNCMNILESLPSFFNKKL